MTLDEALKIVDETITKEWKGMSPDQKKAFSLIVETFIDRRES